MTNEAISAILRYLCHEARGCAQATFGIAEMLRDVTLDSTQWASIASGTASADQLLCSIDDFRELVSTASPPAATLEEFDLVRCAGQVIEALNMASSKRWKQMVMDGAVDSLPVTQDRKAVEQMLTRVLDAALKLAKTSQEQITLNLSRGENCVRLTIATEAGLAVRLVRWLNASPELAMLQDPEDVPLGVAVMVAGKRLLALGGSAGLAGDSVVLELPSAHREASEEEALPGGLRILVAEDSDESFVLTKMLLEGQNVWRARDGQEALTMTEKQRFDLVFMDIHMPGMDGYEVIRSMRYQETQAGDARTPIVVLSSDDLETQRQSAAECGCSGFLAKPLRQWDLTSLLDRVKQDRLPLA